MEYSIGVGDGRCSLCWKLTRLSIWPYSLRLSLSESIDRSTHDSIPSLSFPEEVATEGFAQLCCEHGATSGSRSLRCGDGTGRFEAETSEGRGNPVLGGRGGFIIGGIVLIITVVLRIVRVNRAFIFLLGARLEFDVGWCALEERLAPTSPQLVGQHSRALTRLQ